LVPAVAASLVNAVLTFESVKKPAPAHKVSHYSYAKRFHLWLADNQTAFLSWKAVWSRLKLGNSCTGETVPRL
jgi:hypothetical protein